MKKQIEVGMYVRRRERLRVMFVDSTEEYDDGVWQAVCSWQSGDKVHRDTFMTASLVEAPEWLVSLSAAASPISSAATSALAALAKLLKG